MTSGRRRQVRPEAVVALGGFATLLAAAFGLRTLVHRRRTGTTGWVPAPTPAARAGDGLFAVGAAATLAAPALELAGVVRPWPPAARSRASASAGAALVVAGSAVSLTAQGHMGSAWRAGIDLSADDELVTTGLFRVVRNPFYTGILLAAAGAALMVPSAVALAAWVALLAGCQIDVRLVEEPHLRAAHGEAYSRYEASTPRFLPRLCRSRIGAAAG